MQNFKILIANWKTNPKTLEEAKVLFKAENQPGVIVCPPPQYLRALKLYSYTAVKLGAQDCTLDGGEQSPAALKKLGVTHCLVGHSDRRKAGDTDKIVNQKLAAVLKAGIIPVLLGDGPDQIMKAVEGAQSGDADKILYVYEPVWAISTNPNAHPATPKHALSAISKIKTILDQRFALRGSRYTFLYGGSVNAYNIENFLKHPEIGGAVVGAASLRPAEFKKMIEIAEELS